MCDSCQGIKRPGTVSPHSTVRNIFVFWNLAFLNQKQWFWRLDSSRRILVLIWSIPISKMTPFNWEMSYLKNENISNSGMGWNGTAFWLTLIQSRWSSHGDVKWLLVVNSHQRNLSNKCSIDFTKKLFISTNFLPKKIQCFSKIKIKIVAIVCCWWRTSECAAMCIRPSIMGRTDSRNFLQREITTR